jgi:hypothetical protein
MAKRDSVAARRRREHWLELLGRWRASGLTQAAFCRRQGVRPQQFSWWKRRLGVGRARAWSSRARASGMDRTGTGAGPTFVPVQVVGTALRGHRLELVLGTGQRLRFPAELEPARLAAFVTALAAAGASAAEVLRC